MSEIQNKKIQKDEYLKKKKAERRKRNKQKDKPITTNGNKNVNIDQIISQEEIQEVETAQQEIDTLITGADYDNFREIFDNFKSHSQRLMKKTYERYDPDKDKQEDQQDEKELQQQYQQEQQQQEQQQQQQQQQQIPPQQQNIQQSSIQNYLSQGKKKELKLSKKQRKQLRWLKVAELKQRVKRPDLVEFWDITSPDPLFLIQLKSIRNSVSVPRHWSQKRKYLQNKRGVLKDAFQLPDYIEKTGIAKLRDPFVDRDGGKMVRQKLRERMNPKQGKLDIDYQILHDAFFKFQTKPMLTKHGEIYYEGKEDEIRAKNFCPGKMSAELRGALGCTDFQAPPWLPNMQRYGPPPSYPHMRFIGMASIFAEPSSYHTSVKQVIEDNCKKADQPGLYATFKYYDEDDLNELSQLTGLKEEGVIDKDLWGKIEDLEEEEMEYEEEFEAPQQQQKWSDADTKMPSKSISQLISGLQTPEVDLRKPAQSSQQNELKTLSSLLEQKY